MESDGEIEYLEEDAEIVQQCFQTPIVDTKPIPALIPDRNSPSLLVERQSNRTKSLLVERPSPRQGPSLLVERPPKRKRIKQDDDSDYDPNDAVLSPPSPKTKKKKVPPQKKRPKTETPTPRAVKYVKQVHEMKRMKTTEIDKNNLVEIAEFNVSNRKKLNIRIPDYDDPLCLPVKAVRQENSDVKRLDVWNNACIEHFKHCDTMLKPETGATHSSFRTLVMRKVPNKQTGKIETTIWSKTSVQNQDGDKKSEIFQCVLPRYKEKKKMNSYEFVPKKFGHKKSNLSVDVTILSKEKHKDSEALVVYKPKDCVSAVYMLFGQNNESELGDREESRMYMKEMTCCKICADCYQKSWRGAKKSDKKALKCPICTRTCVTVYNLLSHMKTHSSADVKRFKPMINAVLAEIVDYHYKCRICQEKFNCIRLLRMHLKTHKGEKEFLCEVGNHTSN